LETQHVGGKEFLTHTFLSYVVLSLGLPPTCWLGHFKTNGPTSPVTCEEADDGVVPSCRYGCTALHGRCCGTVFGISTYPHKGFVYDQVTSPLLQNFQ
jgi:hypothetical protein